MTLLQKWLENLRSGEFQQGTAKLNNNGKYCCLGVLCETAGLEFKQYPEDKLENWYTKGGQAVWYNGASLPENKELLNEVGLSFELCNLLSLLNDQGLPFESIANLVEDLFSEGLASQGKALNRVQVSLINRKALSYEKGILHLKRGREDLEFHLLDKLREFSSSKGT